METASSIASPRKPGARKLQILQTLATMLEDPKGEKVTTAALAARLGRVRSGAVPPLRQQGPDVRRPDRVHRDDGLRADQRDQHARDVRSEAGAVDRRDAARVLADQQGHDARADRRCAGQRERAPAGTHEPADRAHRIVAAAEFSRGGQRRRKSPRTSTRMRARGWSSPSWSVAGTALPRAASASRRASRSRLSCRRWWPDRSARRRASPSRF